EEHGDQAAAELAESLAVLVRRSSRAHGGVAPTGAGGGGGVSSRGGERGVGLVFHFGERAGAVLAALGMVEELPVAGLPPAHVGVAAGPVVAQGGDYFGRTVHLAGRLAAHARGRQRLVHP